MKRLQAYPFQIEPNGEQQRDLRRFAGSCRFVYNKALATQKALHERGEKKLGDAGLCKSLVEWKGQAELDWLSETPSQRNSPFPCFVERDPISSNTFFNH